MVLHAIYFIFSYKRSFMPKTDFVYFTVEFDFCGTIHFEREVRAD